MAKKCKMYKSFLQLLLLNNDLCHKLIVLVPSAWDKTPSLDTYQRVFVNPILKDKMQVTDINKILQAEDAKMSENQTHEKRSTTENIETEMKLIVMKPINEIASAMKNNASDSSEKDINATIIPRNVILLLIDERDQDEKKEENSWKDYKERLPFAIEGSLQVLLYIDIITLIIFIDSFRKLIIDESIFLSPLKFFLFNNNE